MRLLKGHARLQTPKHIENNRNVLAALGFEGFVLGQRCKQVDRIRTGKDETFGEYTNNHERAAIERNRLSDYVAITAELLLPKVISEERHGIVPSDILVAVEIAPYRRNNARHWQA